MIYFSGANFGRLPFWPSGHGWPYSGDQGLVTIVGPSVVVSVLPTLAANIGNQRCARPSAQLWPRLELTIGPTLANCFRWPWQFSWPTSGPWLNQLSAYYQLDYNRADIALFKKKSWHWNVKSCILCKLLQTYCKNVYF